MSVSGAPCRGDMEESRGLLGRSPGPTAVAATRRAFQAHWRKAVALGLVLGASIVALAVVLAEASTSGSSGGSGGSDSSASALSLSFETEGYGVVGSNEEAIYPWRVVEPHRRTTLTAVFGESLRNVSRDSVSKTFSEKDPQHALSCAVLLGLTSFVAD